MTDSTRALVMTVAQALPFPCPCIPTPSHTAQVINDSHVSDHHAIIPTASVSGSDMSQLPAGERSILTLLMVRLLCAVGDVCRVNETTVTLECEGQSFSAKGRQVTDKGWKAMEQAHLNTLKNTPADDAPVQELPPLNERMTFLPISTSVKEGKTTPPKSHTEATLLSSMETAGAEDMPDDVERKGLGTPATRAGIIEKLVKVGLVERKGGKKGYTRLPTTKGVSLITVLPEELQSPQLTAEWEQKLLRMERGEIAPDAFMRDISKMVRELVSSSHPVPEGGVLFADERKSIGVCPRCGGAVLEGAKGFTCSNRDCRFALWRDNRFFASKKKELTAAMVASLLKDGRVLVKGLYSQKTGRTYDAVVMMDDTGGEYVSFRMEF